MIPAHLRRIVVLHLKGASEETSLTRKATIADANTLTTLQQAVAALHFANLRFHHAAFMVPNEDGAIQEVEALEKMVNDLTLKVDQRSKDLLGPNFRPTLVTLVNKFTAAMRTANQAVIQRNMEA